MSDQRAVEITPSSLPTSPLDVFLAEALRWLQDRQHLTAGDVAKTMSEHLSWPIGFAEVVTQTLFINHLLRSADWEQNKLAVSDHGVAWLHAHESRV